MPKPGVIQQATGLFELLHFSVGQRYASFQFGHWPGYPLLQTVARYHQGDSKMSAINLNDLTPRQLDELMAQAAEAKRRMQRERLGEVRRKLTQLAREEGYSIEELFGGDAKKSRGAGKSTGAAKFANPADASQTWTGRGKRPGWFKAALASGKSADSMLI
jgi:DNA-binding protein H-NS